MRIAIPMTEQTLKSEVAPSFGRAPFFLFSDTETGETSYVENSAATSLGGAGVKAAQIIVDHKAEVLLTPQCGENAAAVMQAAQITLYKTISGSAEDNIAAFSGNKLSSLEDIHAGFHGHGVK